MASATNKTQPTSSDVGAFLALVPDERRRTDAIAVNELMGEVTGTPPVMWGSSMVGFGRQHYRYESGRSGEMMAIGFSPRKAALVLYGLTYDGSNSDLLARLGPHTTGKVCVYVKRLVDLDAGADGCRVAAGARVARATATQAPRLGDGNRGRVVHRRELGPVCLWGGRRPGGRGSPGYYMSPLCSTLLGVLVLRERTRLAQWVALAIAAVAVLVISIGNEQVPWIGIGLGVSFAVYGLLKKTVPLPAAPV